MANKPIEDLLSHLLEHSIVTNNGCREWTGDKWPSGYGRISRYGKKIGTHRVSYGLHHDIPESNWDRDLPETVMHSCDNPACFNPDHLIAGTPKLNSLDMVNKGRNNPQGGESNNNAKLDESSVKFIRNSTLTVKELANKFNVTIWAIYRVKQGKDWTYVLGN